jgi:hypothetical protein
MKIERGFWLSLVNEYKSKVIYQCATDDLSTEEFLTIWNQAGRIVLRELAESKDGSMEFRIRAQRLS